MIVRCAELCMEPAFLYFLPVSCSMRNRVNAACAFHVFGICTTTKMNDINLFSYVTFYTLIATAHFPLYVDL